MTSGPLTIAEVAARTGLTRHALRYYADLVRVGGGNEHERLDLLRAHRGRVSDQIETMTAYLGAIDAKIACYADAVGPAEPRDGSVSSSSPAALAGRR